MKTGMKDNQQGGGLLVVASPFFNQIFCLFCIFPTFCSTNWREIKKSRKYEGSQSEKKKVLKLLIDRSSIDPLLITVRLYFV